MVQRVSQKNLSPAKFSTLLLVWYARNKRDLPWRKTKDPYAVWVSEIMLQQTQVERVKEHYYAQFLQKFPTVRALAQAEWSQVLEAWRGLGYYRRARSLHQAAQILVSEYSGKIPPDFQQLQKLPGVGAYTAGAICSFAFGQNIPALDTNAQKVFGHVFGEKWRKMSASQQWEFARECMEGVGGADFNHAIMDYGSWLRQTGHVHFGCIFAEWCEGVRRAPVREKRAGDVGTSTLRASGATRLGQGTRSPAARVARGGQGTSTLRAFGATRVAVGVLIRDGKVLISLRRADDTLAGYWEFPGGKVEAGETERACLKREMMEELGIEVAVRPAFYVTSWVAGRRAAGNRVAGRKAAGSQKKYVISFHRCSLLLGEPAALEVAEFKWIPPADLRKYRFPPVNQEVFAVMEQKKGMWRV